MKRGVRGGSCVSLSLGDPMNKAKDRVPSSPKMSVTIK